MRRTVLVVMIAAFLFGLALGATPGLKRFAGGIRHRGGEVVMPALAPAGVPCGPRWSPAVEIGALPGDRREVSGFVSSSRHPGVAWMVRDSENPAALYSFELGDGELEDGDGVDGAVRSRAYPVTGARNGDWEDVAATVGADGRGRLWILDNVGRRTSTKTIYEVLEPDPDTDREATVVASYRWEYPDGNLDSEVLFALDGRLVVVSKTVPSRAYAFESPLDPAAMNRPVFAGEVPDGVRLSVGSTGPGDRLLLLSSPRTDTAAVVENRHTPPDLAGFLGSAPGFSAPMTPDQREAGDFFPAGGCDIVLVGEGETVWLLRNDSGPPA